ncbi:MAG: cupin, partial [Bacteroidetes bacterium]
MISLPVQYLIYGNGVFPGSALPVLYYEQALKIPAIFPAHSIKSLFQKTGWTNNWTSGIYTYHHYHSNTHEVMAAISGQSILILGGENGIKIFFRKGDVLVIPAGVAHKNLGDEKDVKCVGGYPFGKDFDMNYGHSGERPRADENLQNVPFPPGGPIYGPTDPLL